MLQILQLVIYLHLYWGGGDKSARTSSQKELLFLQMIKWRVMQIVILHLVGMKYNLFSLLVLGLLNFPVFVLRAGLGLLSASQFCQLNRIYSPTTDGISAIMVFSILRIECFFNCMSLKMWRLTN